MSTATIIFAVSGIAILFLFAAKGFEMRRRKPSMFLHIAKRADTKTGALYFKLLHFYSDSKEKTHLFLNRQAPMKIKSAMVKFGTFLKERREEYLMKMRDARILKKNSGISEFYKNLSNIDKGNGKIEDGFIEVGGELSFAQAIPKEAPVSKTRRKRVKLDSS